MGIPLETEVDPDQRSVERCCFCRTPTDWWTAIPSRSEAQQVACCEICAGEFRQMDVPTKKYWFVVDAMLTQGSARSFFGGRQSVVTAQESLPKEKAEATPPAPA